MIKAGIIEGTGYKAGELIRLLLNHPDVEITWVTSRDHAGMPLSSCHRGLTGETDICFTDTADTGAINALFVCGDAGSALADLPADVKVIDLRCEARTTASIDSEATEGTVYGLPEHARKALVRGATRAVVPGELATALELSLLPLARHLLLNSDIHATAVIGSSEADGSLNEAIHTRRAENVTPSALLAHADVAEVTRLLSGVQSSCRSKVNVVGLDGPFARGLITVTYLDCPVATDELVKLYTDFYDDHNFTFVSPDVPDLKEVVNTNKCLLHLRKSDGMLVIVAVIDNLLKGSAGTAVHDMNLLFGLHERTGLNLKASAF
ncbi:MAG: N-acetyl-gamma-glutamyl-phosphate reductase [Candidatus Amulumruptor caecigallinarius]|nr:N-acetyl-gamma-glutamyl-phosphate reductase [Candidatus Amulumruptor caecigallinarius]MCM1396306.1 N-acetyl-gamma-glutamyl-phosphate reductase [Candidatus Amulumruptor caecigallinarius]MCM1453752.1 N-acetyl-gamma-glutamyl-phosphate reductase [bacterium]